MWQVQHMRSAFQANCHRFTHLYQANVLPSYDYICNGELKIITIVADYNDRIAIVVISSKFPENYCISSRKMNSHEKCHREPLSSRRVQNESESEMGREKRQMHISIEPCANLIISRTWFQDVHKMWRHSFTHIYSIVGCSESHDLIHNRAIERENKKNISRFFIIYGTWSSVKWTLVRAFGASIYSHQSLHFVFYGVHLYTCITITINMLTKNSSSS